MPGLRRVTLNLNTELGDRGARLLSNTLRDDVCLKGMQWYNILSTSCLLREKQYHISVNITMNLGELK